MSDEEKADALWTAMCAGDMDTVKTLVAPKCVVRVPAAIPYAGEYHGSDGFVRLLDDFAAAWTLTRAEMTDRFTRADKSAFVMRFELEGKVTATGEPFATTILETWVFRDGLLTQVAPHWFDIPTSVRRA